MDLKVALRMPIDCHDLDYNDLLIRKLLLNFLKLLFLTLNLERIKNIKQLFQIIITKKYK